MRQYRAIFYMLLACTTVASVSACSRERVQVERKTATQGTSSAPVLRPAQAVAVRHPPPPPREEFQPSSPAPDYVWIPGYWAWGSVEWVWIFGRWQRPPERMVAWVPGQWVQRGDEWIWRKGHWQ